MASQKPRRVWTSRDDDIATFLFRTPTTPDLLFYVSKTWGEPFASLDRTQRRLNDLVQAGWVSRSALAIASQVGPRFYYHLTLAGFRLWRHDPEAPPPTKRFFAPAGDALHQHLYAKARFLAHLTVAAHRRGFRIANDKPENTLTITVNGQSLRPDHYLELVSPSGRHFRGFFEFDRSTETQVSATKLQNTWAQKNLIYDAHQNELGKDNRFRVVPITTQSRDRLENILRLFSEQTTNADRQLYVGVYLDDFLNEADALCHPIFADHRRLHIPFIPLSALEPLQRNQSTKRRKRRRVRRRSRGRYQIMLALREIGWGTRAAIAPHLRFAIDHHVQSTPRITAAIA